MTNNISTGDITALLNTLPTFEPNDNLPLFITKVEHSINTLLQFSLTAFQSVLVTQIILSKIKGSAATNIYLEDTTTWAGIKNALVKHYGDHRNETLLSANLHQLKQNSHDTPLAFYHKIIEAQNSIIQYVQIHLNNPDIKNHEINKTKILALEQFKVGTREPYRSMLFSTPPTSLEDALLKCNAYDNYQLTIKQLHAFNQKPLTHNVAQKHAPQYNPPKFNQNNQQQNFNVPRPTFGDINKQIPQRTTLPTNKQVFKHPIKPQFNNQAYKPTPMSVQTSGFSGPLQRTQQSRHQPNQFYNKQKPSFISEELFNLESQDDSNEYHYESNPYYDEDNDNTSCESTDQTCDPLDENFQNLASNPSQLT